MIKIKVCVYSKQRTNKTWHSLPEFVILVDVFQDPNLFLK